MSQPLFHNPHIFYQGKTLLFIFLIDSGIVTVADICYEFIPGFLPLSAIIEIVNDNRHDISVSTIQTAYYIIIQSLPNEWLPILYNKTINDNNGHYTDAFICTDDRNIASKELTVKFSYSLFVKELFCEPTAISFWDKFAVNINWNKVWKNVFFNDKSSEQIDLDFRLSHNIIFTYEKLFKYGKTDTNFCPVCKNEVEDLFHMYVSCDELYDTISVFKSLFTDLFLDTGFSFNQLVSWLLFGFQPDKSVSVQDSINILLSVYRISVFKKRAILSLQQCNLNLEKLFNSYVKRHFNLLWTHYQFKKRADIFIQRYIMPVNFMKLDGNKLIFKPPFHE